MYVFLLLHGFIVLLCSFVVSVFVFLDALSLHQFLKSYVFFGGTSRTLTDVNV